jgi:hypothetical protein
MDIGRELRVIEVDDPFLAPDEIERVLVEDMADEPAETGPNTG